MRLPIVKLCVRKYNKAAIELYEHLGYRQVEVWPAYYRIRKMPS